MHAHGLLKAANRGLVEFVESEHDFSVVGGMEYVKAALGRVVDAIRRGDKRRVPMGILIVGPMGTGKSFVIEAFANEVGMTALKFKNFPRWPNIPNAPNPQ